MLISWRVSLSLIQLIILLQEIENADESLLEDGCEQSWQMASKFYWVVEYDGVFVKNPSNQKYFLRISHVVSGKQHETSEYFKNIDGQGFVIGQRSGSDNQKRLIPRGGGLGLYSVINVTKMIGELWV